MARRIKVRSGPIPRKVTPPASAASLAGTDSDAIHDNVSAEISAITEKTILADDDLFLIEDSAASNVKKKVKKSNLPGGGGAAPSVPEWVSYLAERQGDETPHADDDFFDDGSKAGTELTVSGNATWLEARGVLSVRADGQTSADAAATLWAITSASAPMTIETAVRIAPNAFATDGSEFAVFGFGFTDGVISSSNWVGGVHIHSSTTSVLRGRSGTLTNIAAVQGAVSIFNNPHRPFVSHLYMRTIWTATNTFKTNWSFDGVTWVTFKSGTLSKTMTPTHYTFLINSAATEATEPSLAALDYLRVYDSDLSV